MPQWPAAPQREQWRRKRKSRGTKGAAAAAMTNTLGLLQFPAPPLLLFLTAALLLALLCHVPATGPGDAARPLAQPRPQRRRWRCLCRLVRTRESVFAFPSFAPFPSCLSLSLSHVAMAQHASRPALCASLRTASGPLARPACARRPAGPTRRRSRPTGRENAEEGEPYWGDLPFPFSLLSLLSLPFLSLFSLLSLSLTVCVFLRSATRRVFTPSLGENASPRLSPSFWFPPPRPLLAAFARGPSSARPVCPQIAGHAVSPCIPRVDRAFVILAPLGFFSPSPFLPPHPDCLISCFASPPRPRCRVSPSMRARLCTYPTPPLTHSTLSTVAPAGQKGETERRKGGLCEKQTLGSGEAEASTLQPFLPFPSPAIPPPPRVASPPARRLPALAQPLPQPPPGASLA